MTTTATATAPNTDQDEAITETTPRLSLIDLYLLANPIAAALGDGWAKDDDTPTDERTIRLTHTDGRAIGIRLLWDGIAAQTYAEHPKQQTYNAGAHFVNAEDPLDTLLNTVNLRLMPAFHDHRPKLNRAGTPIPPPTPDADDTHPATPDPQPATSPDDGKPASDAPAPTERKPARRKATKTPSKKTATTPRKRAAASTKRKPATKRTATASA
ncbi:hypothetical protein ABZ705_30705 [Streptomyces sp. NPDC006984]|uniref:hypothetical protein n=1 Tax=Streptomyces sp. NPDC006984 TaxID=3155463 RepID=UPI0034046E09